jgi:hypothetical protein
MKIVSKVSKSGELTLNKVYDVKRIHYYDINGFECVEITKNINYVIIDDLGYTEGFASEKFMTLEEYRELVIDKILA